MKKLTNPITALILSLISFSIFALTALVLEEGNTQLTLMLVFFLGFVALLFARPMHDIYLTVTAKKN